MLLRNDVYPDSTLLFQHPLLKPRHRVHTHVINITTVGHTLTQINTHTQIKMQITYLYLICNSKAERFYQSSV